MPDQVPYPNNRNHKTNDIVLGYVVKVYPETNTVDAVVPPWETPVEGIQMLSQDVSHIWGSINSPDARIERFEPDTSDSERSKESYYDATIDKVYMVVIGYLGRSVTAPVGLGFITPSESAMLFDPELLTRDVGGTETSIKEGLTLDRHVGGVVTLKDKFGNHEYRHPSGLKVKVGPDTEFFDESAAQAGGTVDYEDPEDYYTATRERAASEGDKLPKLIHIEHDAFTLDVDLNGAVKLDILQEDIEITKNGNDAKRSAREGDTTTHKLNASVLSGLTIKDGDGSTCTITGEADVPGSIDSGSDTLKVGD